MAHSRIADDPEEARTPPEVGRELSGDYGRAMTNVLKVVAAVIRDGDDILVCRRRADRTAGGRWEFPGGKVEKGESTADALRREVLEELAINIRVLGELTTDTTLVGDLNIRLTCLHAELEGPRPTRSTDHDNLAWVAVGDLGQLDWAEPDLPAVRLLIASGT